ncbi:MAG: PAS domain-containing protein [Verrucomicrobiota bacterium]
MTVDTRQVRISNAGEWANAAFTAYTGYTVEEAIGKTLSLLKSDKHGQAFYQNLWQTVSSGAVWHGEMINWRKDGTLYPEEIHTQKWASEGCHFKEQQRSGRFGYR